MKTEKKSILIGIIVSGLFAWLSTQYFEYSETPPIQRPYRPFFESFEVLNHRFNDLKFQLRPETRSSAPVALIALDDASIKEIGRWPWSREMVAEMTDKLLSLGAQSVAFDVIFAEPETSNPTADSALASVIQKYPDQVVLGTFSENLTLFEAHQDLCVAEAFLATGGDQMVKINPSFAIDEEPIEYDDLNWSFLFQVFFSNIQKLEEERFLKSINRDSLNELSTFQRNHLQSRLSSSLFDYCKTWLTEEDIFLTSDNRELVSPLYADVLGHDEQEFFDLDLAIQNIRNAYKPHPIPQYGEWTSNISELQKPANYTASFIAQLDSDGYVRRYPLFFRSGNKLGSSFIPSIALQSFLLSGSYRAELKVDTRSQGDKRLSAFKIFDTSTDPETEVSKYPIDKSGQLLINYQGRQMSLPYVPAKELFNDSPTLQVFTNVHSSNSNQLVLEAKEYNKADFFKGRSLIVGATAVGLYDLRNTPVEANFPGPELHLTLLANLFDNNFLKYWEAEAELAPWLLLATGSALAIAWAFAGPIASTLGFLFFIFLLGSLDLWLFIEKNILLNSLLIYLTVSFGFFLIQLFKYFTEERKKKELKSTFSKYVSPAVVDELLKDADNLKLGGRRERMTAFFSDVRGFTTISEKLTPEELSQVLNLYLTPMTNIVFENKGTLDKYMGDAIMAFFGAPVKDTDHAKNACLCALKSLQRLEELQQDFAEKGLPHIDIGIGINTGEMSVGNMGSNIVQNYTIMGDSVNLASRLEGINKEYGTRIIISEFTYEDIKDSFYAREIDWVLVKGKTEPVRIFELLCEGSIPSQQAEMVHLFEEAYELYHQRKFEQALEIFQKADKAAPDSKDPVSQVYIQRCRDYLNSPPPENWDGVYTMTSK